MYRILCLHGRGSSSHIFETQLTALRKRLHNDFELVFVDGESKSERGYGIPHEFPGPYWAYLGDFTPDSVQAGHELLGAMIDEEGPFDGVFAFSEGASLVLSFLLQLERNNGGEAAPFNFALLFSPAVVLSPDLTFLSEEIDSMTSEDFDNLAEVCTASKDDRLKVMGELDYVNLANFSYQQDLSVRRQVLNSSNSCTFRIATRTGAIDGSQWRLGLAQRDKSCVPRTLHPALLKERIQVATVYVSGLNEEEDFKVQDMVLPHLFHTGCIVRLAHKGGHDVPRSDEDVQKIIDALNYMIEESKLPGY